MKYPVNPLDPKTFVVCEICKKKFTRIKNNHLLKHNIDLDQYKKIYTDKNIISKFLREKFSITEKNLIKKHGKEIGTQKWKDYCELQKYVGVKLEYFIEKHGEKEGTKIYKEMLDKKCHNKWFGHSKTANLFFSELDKLIKDQETFFIGKNNEFRVKLTSTVYKPISLDYYSLTKNKAIEFYGDYWHGNPLIFKDKNIILRSGKNIEEKHKEDKLRVDLLKKEHNIDVLIIWELDVKNDRAREIEKCMKFLT